MLATTPMSALELCDSIKNGKAFDASRLNRILGLDAIHGLLEVQAATPWHAIAAELRPGDARANVSTTMPTVGESIARNAAGPDGTPSVDHVASLTVVTADGSLRRVSRQRDRDLFALIVGGHGLFGTVYSITLRMATLARAVERATRPQEMRFQRCRANRTLELLIPPESLDAFVAQTDTRCSDWRIPLQSVAVRQTAREDDSYLRWARRDYAEVKLALAEPAGLGAAVRGAQLRHELIDAAIEAGGSFHIACTADATREQTEACYPQLKTFLAEKRRFDPEERLVNAWYVHQRDLLNRKPCEVRWAS
ncbi:MAG TPA: FAD-binding protein [Burkholderiales bacterium]|nr:FAD-binding protein [Burkholderiales bacterium]